MPLTTITKTLYQKIKKGAKIASLVLGIAMGINMLGILGTYTTNNIIKSKEKTAVFTSGNDDQLFNFIPPEVKAKFIDFLMYTPVTLRQNLNGNHVDWYSHANKNLILSQLENPQNNNVVFIGHGSYGSYKAADGRLWFYDIDEKIKKGNIKAKNGELIQHTCGVNLKELLDLTNQYYPYKLELIKEINKGVEVGEKSFREVLFPNSNKGYINDGFISPQDNYFRAWKELYKTTTE